MMTVHEVAKMAGVSVRTLHYYDQLGLLPPAGETAAGYRLYSKQDLQRLQRILFLRELDFPLKEIGPMLAAEQRDNRRAVEQHRELLRAKITRLQGLIDLCGRLLEGEGQMDLQAFDTAELDNKRQEYAKEARERWGNTDAYRESEKRTAAYGKKEWAEVQAEGNAILAELGSLTGQSPVSDEVRAAVRKWQAHISARYYPCTDEILAGLGEMYVADERFARTIDAFGAGTAQLMREAIRRINEK